MLIIYILWGLAILLLFHFIIICYDIINETDIMYDYIFCPFGIVFEKLGTFVDEKLEVAIMLLITITTNNGLRRIYRIISDMSERIDFYSPVNWITVNSVISQISFPHNCQWPDISLRGIPSYKYMRIYGRSFDISDKFERMNAILYMMDINVSDQKLNTLLNALADLLQFIRLKNLKTLEIYSAI